MRERIEERGGRVEFNTVPGRGFEVRAHVPAQGRIVVIRLALIEDQTLVRRGLRALLDLTGDMAIVAEAADGEEGARVIRRERPDVVLLDVRMPGKNGIDLLTELRRTDELPPTILLTTFDDDEALLDGIRAGARGYLLKDVSLEQLADAIRTVSRGET